MYKKILLLIIILLLFCGIGAFEVKSDWTHKTVKTNEILSNSIKIHITPDSAQNIEKFYAIASVVEGKSKILNDKVYANKNGDIVINLKSSSKMENSIIMVKILYDDNLVKVMNFSIFSINWLEVLFGIIGGLGLFLFGMKYMSDGLQKTAGDNLRNIIGHLTKNTFFAVIVGLTVTSIIQSSSATTVMVVGFVNAGIMNLMQSIGVIMGANIGTTVTAQLIAFKLGDYALPAIAIGVALLLFSKKSKYRFWGEVLFGFGLLFLGMSMMSATVHPLRQSPQIVDFFIRFSVNPILAALTGMLITFIVQSSSATVGLTMVLASQGLIDIYGAVPLVLGENIGTTITAAFASLSSNRNGKRAALIHALFNIIGVTYMLLGFYFIKIRGVPAYLRLVDFFTPGDNLNGENISRYIANSHTIFNVFNTIIFLPFAGVLKVIVEKIIPEKKEEKEALLVTKYLDNNLLNNPSIALGQVKKEMQYMFNIAKESLNLSTDIFINKDTSLIERVEFLERKTDYLQNAITQYIINISKEALFDKEAEQLPVYIHSINDIERIGDHAVNLTELYIEKQNTNIEFSERAIEEINKMRDILNNMIDTIIKNLEEYNIQEIENVFILENTLNKNELLFTKNHAKRIANKECNIGMNSIFNDIMSNYEKMGDHIVNIAQAIKNEFKWSDI